jgi:hypothetical protein
MAVVVEAEVSGTPGEIVVRVVMALGMRAGGAAPMARMTSDGAVMIPVARKKLGGMGEIAVTPRETGCVVRLVGQPPPWPFSMGWGRRLLSRALGSTAAFSWRDPASAG